MATRTVAPGGGDWTNPATFVEGFAPTAADDVVLDASSGTLTIDTGAVGRSLDCDLFTGELIHNGGVNLNLGDATAGAGNIALRFSAAMTYTKGHASTSSISFISTSATVQDIYWGGKTTGNVTYNASSNGSWRYMSDHYWTDYIATVTFTKGTLDTNSFNLKGGQFLLSNSNVRTLTMGASVFDLSGVGNNCFMCATVTNLTVTANTAIIKMYRSLSCFAPLLQSATKDWNGMSVKFYGGGIQTFASGGNPTFYRVENNGGPDLGDGREDRLQMNNSFTVTATTNAWVINGYSDSRRFRVHSNGGVRTITVPNTTCVTGQYVDFQGTTLTNTNDLSGILGGAGDMSLNSGIIFATAINCYFYAPTPGVKLWEDPTHWFLATGGTGGQARKPLPQDNAYFDASSFPVSGVTVRNTIDSTRLGKDVIWNSVTNNPTWDFQYDVINYGSLELDPNMSVTAYATAFFTMFGSGTGQFFTVKFSGIELPHTLFLINFAGTNTCTFLDDFVGNSLDNNQQIQFTGLIDFNDMNVTAGRFVQSSGTINMKSGTFTITGTGTIWNSGGTVVPGTSNIVLTNTSSTARTFAGGSKVYNNLQIDGPSNTSYTFTGSNTFVDFTDNNAVAHELLFTASTNTTFTGTVTCAGTVGNQITLRSTTATAFTWTKASGTVNCDYLILSRSTAAGGATFNAGANTVNGGNNTGWSGLVTDPFTWTGADFAVNLNWDNPLNWSGGAVPTSSDVAWFTGLGTIRNCTMNAGVLPKGLKMLSGYTGIITQSSNIVIGTDGIEQMGGTFTGGAFTITNNGPWKQILGTWTNCSGLFTQYAQGPSITTWSTAGGTFSANTGTVEIVGSLDAIITNVSARPFYKLIYNTSGQVSGTHFTTNDFTRVQGAIFNSDISVQGDYLGTLISGDVGEGTGILRMTNTVTKNMVYPKVASLQFNATGTITLSNDIEVNGTFTNTAATSVNGFSLNLRGNVSLADTAVAGTTVTNIIGTAPEQTLTGVGVLPGDVTINKDAGMLKLVGHATITDIGKTLYITKGQLATNSFSLSCPGPIEIGNSGALNKLRDDIIFYTSLVGSITQKQKVYQESLLF